MNIEAIYDTFGETNKNKTASTEQLHQEKGSVTSTNNDYQHPGIYHTNLDENVKPDDILSSKSADIKLPANDWDIFHYRSYRNP